MKKVCCFDVYESTLIEKRGQVVISNLSLPMDAMMISSDIVMDDRDWKQFEELRILTNEQEKLNVSCFKACCCCCCYGWPCLKDVKSREKIEAYIKNHDNVRFERSFNTFVYVEFDASGTVPHWKNESKVYVHSSSQYPMVLSSQEIDDIHLLRSIVAKESDWARMFPCYYCFTGNPHIKEFKETILKMDRSANIVFDDYFCEELCLPGCIPRTIKSFLYQPMHHIFLPIPMYKMTERPEIYTKEYTFMKALTTKPNLEMLKVVPESK